MINLEIICFCQPSLFTREIVSVKTQVQLTVALPVFNGEDHLSDALTSLLAQTYSNFKLVISDNASTDQTPIICDSFCRKDNRIVYVRHSVNRGASWNFAYSLQSADTPFFMWAACDDLWHPDFILRCLQELISDSNIVVASSLVVPFGNGLNMNACTHLTSLSGFTRWHGRYRFLSQPEEYGKANLIYGIYRTSVLKSVAQRRLFDECWGADMLFVYRCLTYGMLLVLDQPLFYKRQASTSSLGLVHTPSTTSEHEMYAVSAVFTTLRHYCPYYWNYALIDLGDSQISPAQKLNLIKTSALLLFEKIWLSLRPLLKMLVRHRREALMKAMLEWHHKLFR
jgi:glycosyltransferase involved in cell wall biosynthesis